MFNDNGIDYGLARVFRALPAESQERIHVFGVHFFTKLTEVPPKCETYDVEKNFAGVRRWTKHVDLFAKDFVVVPRYLDGHFSLAVIVRPGLVQPLGKMPVKIEKEANAPVLLHMEPLCDYHNSSEIATALYQ
jgi:sentrin-specific protease 7